MDNVVTQEVFKRIDTLAEKLGTTAQYLWPKLVAYQYGKALGFAVGYAVICVLFFGGIAFAARFWGAIDESNSEGATIGSLVVLGIIAIVGFFIVTLWAVPVLISPEAAAFYKLVGK